VSVQPGTASPALPGPDQDTLDELVVVLALEPIEENIYRGHHPSGGLARTFGGLTAAQALVAATRTVDPERRLHSLHSYFLRPGDPTVPTVFLVQRIRDGGSFSTRRVHGVQHGKAIYSFAASFQRPEPGFDHADDMPSAPDPESLPTMAQALAPFADRLPVSSMLAGTVDLRAIDPSPYEQRDAGPRAQARHRVWMRAAGRLPDDRVVHDAVLAYLSDVSLLHPVLVRHGVSFSLDPVMGASLDHAVWFHRDFRADEWLLYDAQSPSASGGRGLAFGRLFAADGRLVASVAQEGLVRPVDPEATERLNRRYGPLRG
jgi:acyl-CoA thioesterase-2